jgi:ribonuclease HI
MSKYYAVKNGIKPGVYTNWNDAKMQVNGFKGAIYKSFKTIEEADFYMLHEDVKIIINKPDKQKSKLNRETIKLDNKIDLLIYTDGSCKNNIGGYGIVLIHNPNTLISSNKHSEFHDKVPYDHATNNIAELYAIQQALLLCMEYKDNKIILRTDSNYSIEAVTKNINKQKYNNYLTSNGTPVKNLKLILNINNLMKSYTNLVFEHVYSHDTDYYNDIVDRLAKKYTIF